MSRIWTAEDGWRDAPDHAHKGDHSISKIKADAWDDGYAVGQTDYESTRTNPYREDEANE